MRHAIVGAGFGAVHLPAFAGLPGVEVVALADSGSGRAQRCVRPGMAAFSDWQRMLDAECPDTLSVVVPPKLQREIVAGALTRGIHVLCEKPVGACPEDVECMLEQARASERVVAASYQYRFEPGLAALREQLRLGRLGRVRRVDFSWITAGRADPSRAWGWQHDSEQGGGVINAFLPHMIDLIAWLSGNRVVRVLGRTAVLIPHRRDASGEDREVTAEDLVDALLELDEGCVVNLRVTNCQFGGEGMRIELHSERGTLRFMHHPPFDSPQIVEYAWGDTTTESVPLPATSQAGMDPRVPSLARLAESFIEAARGQEQADLPSCADAMAVQKVISALRASCATQQFQTV